MVVLVRVLLGSRTNIIDVIGIGLGIGTDIDDIDIDTYTYK